MKAIHPLKLLFLSFFIWVIFYNQIPVRYIYEGSSWYALFTIVLFLASFSFGIISLKKSSLKERKPNSSQKIKQITYLLFIIGLLGVLIKIYIGFFKTGIFSEGDIFELRLENMSKELTGGFIGALASVLYPFSFLTLLIVIYNIKIFNKLFLVLVLPFGLYPLIETFFMGGRTIIALLCSTLIFVIYASFFKNTSFKTIKFNLLKNTLFSIPKFIFKKRVLIPLLLIVFLFTSYSIKVLDTRLTRFNYGDNVFKVWEQKDYQWVKFDKEFKEDFFVAAPEDKSRMLGIMSLKHYFVHGVFEYIRLVNDLEKSTGYYYGQYEFNVFFKFFRLLGVPLKSFNDLNVIVKRQSVYQTFWGPFYIDFGLFGIVVIFFWGRFTKRVYLYAKQESTAHLILYAYLSTILITSFYLNFLLGSSSYFLFAFLVCLLIFKYWPNNLKFVIRNR